MTPELVDSVSSLSSFLPELPTCRMGRPDLYIDLEGDDLCRRGTLSLVTIFVESRRTVHLVDVTTLRGEAFSTTDSSGRTLKHILEAKDIIKVFFDIRNDSDALFSHYGIAVQGIEDVQLMELATRTASKRLVNGLAKCIEGNPDIDHRERYAWRLVKDRGQRLFKSGKDGYAIFDRRPLPEDVLEYCVQDVTFLPKLRDSYRANLCNASWRKIEEETLARIALSQSSSFNGKGRHMSLGPPSWQNWHPSLAERQERSLLQDEKPAEAPMPVTATAPTPARQDRASEDEIGVIVRALQSVMNRTQSPAEDRKYDSDDFGGGDSGGYRDELSSREQSPRDYTACDIECGYCGHCGY